MSSSILYPTTVLSLFDAKYRIWSARTDAEVNSAPPINRAIKRIVFIANSPGFEWCNAIRANVCGHSRKLLYQSGGKNQRFGHPIETMSIELDADRVLARANAEEVLEQLRNEGFYLQLPPATQDWRS